MATLSPVFARVVGKLGAADPRIRSEGHDQSQNSLKKDSSETLETVLRLFRTILGTPGWKARETLWRLFFRDSRPGGPGRLMYTWACTAHDFAAQGGTPWKNSWMDFLEVNAIDARDSTRKPSEARSS